MSDKRAGRNIQRDMTNLLLQSVYNRLAGYEDVSDSQLLSVDPAGSAVTGKKKNATRRTGISNPWILEKINEYHRTWLRKLKTGLQSNGILAILCHKVDMGNI